MSNNVFKCQASRQSGAVLITGLIFLVILTMVVLTVLRNGTLEERMAANSRNRQVALQAAESVLRNAEAALFTAAPFDPFDISQFSSNCANGLCYKPDANSTWQTINWDSTALTRSFVAATSNVSGVSAQPRYIVEIVVLPVKSSSTGQCENGLAKITARGSGNDGSAAYIQSTVRFKVFTNICNY